MMRNYKTILYYNNLEDLIDMPFKDNKKEQNQSGGLESVLCKCGAVNSCKDEVLLKCIAAVDNHLKNCHDKNNCNDHGQSMPFLCGKCKTYLCSVLFLKEEFLK